MATEDMIEDLKNRFGELEEKKKKLASKIREFETEITQIDNVQKRITTQITQYSTFNDFAKVYNYHMEYEDRIKELMEEKKQLIKLLREGSKEVD